MIEPLENNKKQRKVDVKKYEEALKKIKMATTSDEPVVPNELRKGIGLDPIPGGDFKLIPKE